MALQATTLSQLVQQYLQLDEELHEIQNQQKELREKRTQVQTRIIEYMKDNDLEHRTLKTGNTQLSIISRKQYSAISFSYLDKMLRKIIPDTSQIPSILQYLKENREVKVVSEIRHNTV
jgi:seryl-tRNA synthetase